MLTLICRPVLAGATLVGLSGGGSPRSISFVAPAPLAGGRTFVLTRYLVLV